MWGDVGMRALDDFRRASERVYLGEKNERPDTIGIRKEHRLHAILKYYLAPDDRYHEVRVGKYWADILRDGHIYEVQTRRLDRLKTKVQAFLKDYDVTVVYPAVREKTLSWIDPTDGTVTSPRKSPLHGTVYHSLYELVSLADFLDHPRFHVRVLLFDMQEYRALTGYGKNRKIRAPRTERIPKALVGDYLLDSPTDYAHFLPENLSEPFTVKMYAKETGVPADTASRAVRVLSAAGVIRRAGKRGNAFLYEREESHNESV